MARTEGLLTPSRLRANLTRDGGILRDRRAPLVEPVTAPQHFSPPTPRELRDQAVQRLQLGIFGLVIVLLMVGLANIIMQHAHTVDSSSGLTASGKLIATNNPDSTDPLADIGVAPSPEASSASRRPVRSGNH